jgi:tetratricopeptide (TPR) repeat protein
MANVSGSDQGCRGSHTNIDEANAPVLSGIFSGPVNVYPRPKPEKLIPREIPRPPDDFTGRDDELQDVVSNFKPGSPGVSLHGMGGVGKTALAFALAERIKDRFPDGHLFIKLEGMSPNSLNPAQAMAQVIRSFGPTRRLPESEAELANLYRSVLDGKCALLLLDNALDDKQVRSLLPPTKCSLIITSRRKFKLPGMVAKDLEVLKLDKAVELLLKMACPDLFDVNHKKDGTWEELARLCGCLPVALRAAGSYLANTPDSSPVRYLKELHDERKRLGRIGKEGVEEDLESKMSLSYSHLEPEATAVFRQLSVFPADFDSQAEEEVCQDGGHRHLSDLVRWSLVEYQCPEAEGEGRYHLHDLVRIFAARRLETAVKADVQQRHAEHYLKVLASANTLYLQGRDGILAGLKLFDVEKSNILAGQSWAVENLKGNSSATKLCNSYPNAGRHVLDLRLHPRQKIEWLNKGMEAARCLSDRSMEGKHLGNLGSAYFALGDARKAIEYYGPRLAIAREIGDRKGEGTALGNLGNAYADLGDERKAIEYYKQALAIDREIGDRRGEGADLGNLGNAYAALGDVRKAIEYHEQALAIDREIGDRRGEGADLGNLGVAYRDLGDERKAIEYYKQALVIDREIGDKRGEANACWNLGLAYEKVGELEGAIDLMQVCIDFEREIGHPDAEKDAEYLENVRARLGKK